MKVKPHRGVELSLGTQREIIGMHKARLSFAVIEKETRIKANTAGKIWARRNIGYHGYSTRNASQNIRKYVLKDRNTQRQPLRNILNTPHLNVHPDTIYKALMKMGLGHHVECKKPWL
jgi:hypothetical protein